VNAYEQLRAALVARRKELKLTQAAVGRAMGTTQSAVSDLERGRTKDPCIATLGKWAFALELELIIDIRVTERGAA